MIATLPDEVVDHYLALLGMGRAKPSLAVLRDLVAAHLTRIPFENVSKLYYRKVSGLKTLPDIRLYLEGIERYHFGGTCYSNNYHFHLLLRSLGYEAKLCAADMKNPGVHAVNMITVDGREYLVDAGYAAPFLEPIPRDLKTGYEIRLGRDRYVLQPQDARGCSRLQLFRNEILRHGYLARPARRNLEDFGHVIAASFSADATFLNALLLVRFWPGRSIAIHNLSVIESRGEEWTARELKSREDLIEAIEHHFGMPRQIVGEAINQLDMSQDAWS
jgi:N-hydroxyarylamine O-acetyltransferase